MRQIIPNITTDNCRAALDYYQGIFGGEIKNLQLADGKEMFRGHEGQIVHAELHINQDCVLYMNDPMGGKAPAGGNISLMLALEGKAEIDKLYADLSKQGKVIFELQKTFWGSYHAVVIDRFGTNWNLDFAQG